MGGRYLVIGLVLILVGGAGLFFLSPGWGPGMMGPGMMGGWPGTLYGKAR